MPIKQAFSGCSGLTSVKIGNGVTSIGKEAFWYCSELASIVIPKSVISIGEGVFAGCKALTKIEVEPNNKAYHVKDNCLIQTESKTLIAGFRTSKIPDDGSVTSIGSSAFRGCSGLTSIDIPDSVTSIGKEAFAGCSGLTSIIIPDSVTSIGYGAFAVCTGLTTATIGSGVTEIGQYAFQGSDSLKKVYFENPNGWKVWREYEDASQAKYISGLDDPATAVRWLLRYYDYYWKREG